MPLAYSHTHTHTLKQEKATIFMMVVTKTNDMSVLDNFEVLSLFLLTKLVATTKSIVCRLPPSTLPPPSRPYIALLFFFILDTHTKECRQNIGYFGGFWAFDGAQRIAKCRPQKQDKQWMQSSVQQVERYKCLCRSELLRYFFHFHFLWLISWFSLI